jgi:hypothetical protein
MKETEAKRWSAEHLLGVLRKHGFAPSGCSALRTRKAGFCKDL